MRTKILLQSNREEKRYEKWKKKTCFFNFFFKRKYERAIFVIKVDNSKFYLKYRDRYLLEPPRAPKIYSTWNIFTDPLKTQDNISILLNSQSSQSSIIVSWISKKKNTTQERKTQCKKKLIEEVSLIKSSFFLVLFLWFFF